MKKNAHSILDPFFHETSNLDIALLNSKIDAVIRKLTSVAHSPDSYTKEAGKVSVKKRIKPSSISSSPTSESTQISKMSENQSTKQSENQPSSDNQISSEYTQSAESLEPKRKIVRSEPINMKMTPEPRKRIRLKFSFLGRKPKFFSISKFRCAKEDFFLT